MTIGIVTVLFKSDSVIDGFINSLNNQTEQNIKVCFIDNDIGESEICRNKIMSNATFKYEYIKNQLNVGVAKANNQGIDFFTVTDKTDYIMFLNNDTEFDSGFIEQHVELFKQNRDIHCIAPRILYYDTRAIWYAGGKISFLKSGVVHFGHRKKEKFGQTGIYKCDYAPTCSFIVETAILEMYGVRMWEELFVYCDDYQFCIDLKRNGVTIFYIPEIVLLHKVSSSTGGKASDFSRYYSVRNKYYLMRKHKSAMFWVFHFMLIVRFVTGNVVERKAMLDSLRM